MMIKVFVVCTMLGSLVLQLSSGCTQAGNEADPSFGFKPQEDKTYQLAITRISAIKSAFATTGDTLLFNLDLRLIKRDSAVNKMLLTVHTLKLSRVPFKQMATTPKASGITLSMDGYLKSRDSIFQSVAGDTLIVFIDKQGQLLMEDGFDRLINSVSEKTKVEVSHTRAVLRDHLSPAAVKDLFARIFFYLPGKLVKEKDSWVNNVMLSSMAPVKQSNMIQLNRIDEQKYMIDVSARITAGGQGTEYMRGTKTGTVTADRTSGFPLLLTMKESTITETTGGEINGTNTLMVTCTSR